MVRDGEVKLRIPVEQHSDGTLWATAKKGEAPLLDGKAPEAPANMAELANAYKWDEIPAACFARLGTSASGLTVAWADEYMVAPKAELTAAQKARQAVDALFDEAERAEHASYYDPERIIKAQIAAKAALEEWQDAYPTEAKEEKRARLIAKAEHEESLASGALTYDADGWIDSVGQQKRHDEYMAKAAELRKQAAAL
jgi:hypothetical protein